MTDQNIPPDSAALEAALARAELAVQGDDAWRASLKSFDWPDTAPPDGALTTLSVDTIKETLRVLASAVRGLLVPATAPKSLGDGQIERLSRHPIIADRAGVGDGTVHNAVVAVCGALENAEAEVAALKAQLGEQVMRRSSEVEMLRETLNAACADRDRLRQSLHEADVTRGVLEADRDRLRGLVERHLVSHGYTEQHCPCAICDDARKALEGRDG